MPDREPLPPLRDWPLPISRLRERNASSLTPQQIRDIAAAVYSARRRGVPPHQAYGIGSHTHRRRTDEDDLVDAMLIDRHDTPFLTTILNSDSQGPAMPQPLTINHLPMGHTLSDADVVLWNQLRGVPPNIATLVDNVIAENQRLTGEVSSQGRMLLAMEGRLTAMERMLRTSFTVTSNPSPEQVFGTGTSASTQVPAGTTIVPAAGLVRSDAPTGNTTGPAAPVRAVPAVLGSRDATVDVTARSVPVAGGSDRAGPGTAGNGGAAGNADAGRVVGAAGTSGAVPATVPAAAGPIVTVDQLRAAITAYTQRFGIERGRVLMLEHGRASTVSTVPAERRALVLQAIQAASEVPTALTAG